MSITVEEFLDQSFGDILEVGREVFRYGNGSDGEETLDSIRRKVERIKEGSEKLNFKKMEEASHLLENIFYYVDTRQIPVDEHFTRICLKANNLCCNILKSIRMSGLEQSKNFAEVISDIMTYLESHIIGEYPVRDHEILDTSVSDVGELPEEGPPSVEIAVSDRCVPYDGGRVDQMVVAVRELAYRRNHLVKYVESKEDVELSRMGRQLDAVTGKLHDEIMAMKMVPMEEILDELSVRSKKVALRENKEVRLDISGRETYLDRGLVEVVHNALTCLLEHAIVNGIEDARDRLILGKERVGTVFIRIFNEKGHIVFEVRDDGQGIAGVDAVKKSVKEKGGSLEVTTRKGKGTTFLIKIPLKSEILSVLVVESSNVHFCINRAEVISLEKMDDKALEYMRNMEFYRKSGEALPLIRLNEFFNLGENRKGGTVVIVEENGKRFGMIVDNVSGNQEVVLKRLDMGFAGQDVYRGTTIINESELGFVLDGKRLLEEGFSGKRIEFSAGPGDNGRSQEVEAKERMLLFRPEGEKTYGIPLASIERIEEIAKETIEWSGEQAVVRHSGRVLPIPNYSWPGEKGDEKICCIIVDVGGIKKGFVVKNILDGEEVDKKMVTVINPATYWSQCG